MDPKYIVRRPRPRGPESSTCELEDAWTAEIERRVAAYERGEGKLYTADEVMAEAARIAP